MILYLDIDGVLLNNDPDTRADYSIELIDYITNEFDCYWLTTHYKGDTTQTIKTGGKISNLLKIFNKRKAQEFNLGLLYNI